LRDRLMVPRLAKHDHARHALYGRVLVKWFLRTSTRNAHGPTPPDRSRPQIANHSRYAAIVRVDAVGRTRRWIRIRLIATTVSQDLPSRFDEGSPVPDIQNPAPRVRRGFCPGAHPTSNTDTAAARRVRRQHTRMSRSLDMSLTPRRTAARGNRDNDEILCEEVRARLRRGPARSRRSTQRPASEQPRRLPAAPQAQLASGPQQR